MITSAGLNSVMMATSYLGVLMLAGKVLRVKIKVLQDLYLPASLIGGVIGMILGPSILGVIPLDMMSIWAMFPGLLINIVFACIFLGSPIPNGKETWKIAGPQIAYSYIVYALQWIVGLALALFIIKPIWGTDPQIGTIIQVGWTGGHGTAGGMIDIYKDLGFPDGADLGLTSATIGLILGIIFGIMLINIAVRKGWTTIIKNSSQLKNADNSGIFKDEKVVAKSVLAVDSIEPFAFHACLIGASIIIGKYILMGIKLIASVSMPLFPIVMIGGGIIQYILIKTKKDYLVNKQSVNRLQGIALDFLVIAAVSSVNLTVILNYMMPLLILMLGALALMLGVTCYLAPKFFKDTWFERAIVEFGSLTGVLAIGLLLLRIVDPDFESNAAKAVALERPFFSPPVGVLSAVGPILMAKYGAMESLAAWSAFTLILVVFSIKNKWLTLGKKQVYVEEKVQ